MRYPGGKGPLVKKIATYFPEDVSGLSYYEPYAGMASVGRYLIRKGYPFRSFHLSDKFDWTYRLLAAVRGDLVDHGDILERAEEARLRLTPENDKRHSIFLEFDRSREAARNGDYFAFLFLLLYAHDHYVYPQRKDVAPYSQRYIGNNGGISRATPSKMAAWRGELQQATVTHVDAFELLPTLGKDCVCYVDPPYVIPTHQPGGSESGRDAYRLYGCEHTTYDHFRLAGILAKAPYRWLLSYGDDEDGLIRFLYKDFYKAPILRRESTRHKRRKKLWEWLIWNF